MHNVLLHSNWSSLQRMQYNRRERIELCAKTIKHFGNFLQHFTAPPPQSHRIHKKLRSMYPRVTNEMVLKIAKLSHITGTVAILEKARAYGLRPLLWLLMTGDNVLL